MTIDCSLLVCIKSVIDNEMRKGKAGAGSINIFKLLIYVV
jgi:hypothetical protein